VKKTKNMKFMVIASLVLMASLIVMSAASTPVKAQTPNVVTITIIDPVGSGTTNPGSGTYTFNSPDTYTLTATPADGWVFDHWEVSGDLAQYLGINSGDSIQIVDNPVVGNCGYGYAYTYQAVFVSSTAASLPSVPVLYVVIIAIVVAAVAAIGAFMVGKKSK
jgi:hypothetical protein